MVTEKRLNEQFTAAMFGIYEAARRLKPPYVPTDFRSMVATKGGKGAADQLLSGSTPSSGFTQLFLRGKDSLKLSVEYLVLRHPWRSLFTPEQLAEARRRLIAVECEPPEEDRVAPLADQPLAEELEESGEYSEGSTRSILINAYERNPEARAACVKHYGAACTVCGFDFGGVYGAVGAGYIHVHHLTPISMKGGAYTVDPVEDLRPVCANCHAIIHLGGKCRSIHEVRTMMRHRHGSAVS